MTRGEQSLVSSMQQSQQITRDNYSWWIDTFFLLLVLGSLFFILLGTRPLFVPDEGRYAEIAREMVASGNYVTPYLDGIKYFEKPILFYWLAAAAIKTAGLNLWALRSINAFIGLFGCLFTYFTVRKLYDRKTGLLAALILGTSALYFVMVHMISLDLPVTVFLAASLYTFLLGCREPLGLKRRLYLFATAAFAALAVLTKGLIGIVFPAMIIGVWIAILGDWQLLKRIYLPSCLLIFLLIAAPWHVIVGQHNPEFFYFYFIEQHFLRYATVDVGHYQPVWFFIPNLLIGFFPWMVFLPQTIAKTFPPSWKHRQEYKTEIFFLLWVVLIFAFFSFSKSKLIPYILPLFPPLAILTARYLQIAIDQNKYRLGVKIGYILLVIFAMLIAFGLCLFPHYASVPDPKTARIYLCLAALIVMIGSVIGCIYSYRNLAKAIGITVATSWLFFLLILAAIPSVDNRTIQPFAKVLKPILKPGDEVVAFNQYYQDLPFYLEQRVSILNWRNELSFGMQYQDTHDWLLDDNTFWTRWHSPRRVFIVMDLERFHQLQQAYPAEHFYLLGQTLSNALVSNQPIQ